MCQDQKTCLSDMCDGECRYGLDYCKYGRVGVECAPFAPRFRNYKKTTSTEVDCLDWTRRQASMIYLKL